MIKISLDGPAILQRYFEIYADTRIFRRRAVYSRVNKLSKNFVSCVIQPVVSAESHDKNLVRWIYPDAELYEDWLTGKECTEFSSLLGHGETKIGENITFTPQNSSPWSIHQLSYLNDYMDMAGCVVSRRSIPSPGNHTSDPLLVPGQPYYPDIFTAARDWLELRIYHGESDDRNEQVMFLLPENRAYIASAELASGNELLLHVDGIEIDNFELVVKGGAWVGNAIYQIDARVEDKFARIRLPELTDRLEYFLLNMNGEIFDFHKESRHSHGGRKILRSATVESIERVYIAASNGEGRHVEFKPFVNPEQKLYENRQRTKLLEIITTVIAFANAEGGSIYLGVDDDCQIVGVNQKMSEWGHGEADSTLAERYAGALLSVIKDNIEGDLEIIVFPVYVEEGVVISVEVLQAVNRPVNLRDDHLLYVRSGASNRKVPPSQWPMIMRVADL